MVAVLQWQSSPGFDDGARHTVLLIRFGMLMMFCYESTAECSYRARSTGIQVDAGHRHAEAPGSAVFATTGDAGEEDTRLDGGNPAMPSRTRSSPAEAAFSDGIGVQQHSPQMPQQHPHRIGEVVHDEAGTADNEHPTRHQEARVTARHWQYVPLFAENRKRRKWR